MTLECPKCKSPVARNGQRFCYRCGHELDAYYESMKSKPLPTEQSAAQNVDVAKDSRPQDSSQPQPPAGTVILEPNAFGSDQPPNTQLNANLKILLPTGDVFDRVIGDEETQIGKGPRNDLVLADPSVSTAHAVLRRESDAYTIADLGSRNGTFVNGERVTSPRRLTHGDVIGMGLSKLTFRLADYSETGSIDLDGLAAASKPTGRAGPPPLNEESLAEAIVSSGLVSRSDLDRARTTGKGPRLYRALVEDRLASEESLRDLMSRAFEIPVIDLDAETFDDSLIAEFPPRLAVEHDIIGVSRDGDSLILAVADPTDSDAIQELTNQFQQLVRTHWPISVTLRLSTASQIRQHVNRQYGPRLIGVLPAGEKIEYPIDKHDVEIGKAAHNQIVLTDPTVSNTHAVVIARDGGYSIVDLGSRNGTFVNGERLGSKARTLRHGEKIQLGKTVLTFRNPGETAANLTAVLSEEALREVRRRSGVLDSGPEENAAVETVPVPIPSSAPPDSKPASEDSKPGTPASEAVTPAGEDDKDEKKKKKKKKKKEKDARLRAAYVSAGGRIFAAVVSVALTVALTLYLTRGGLSPSKEGVKISKKGHAKLQVPKASSGTPFEGGAFEASGVVQVPGTDGVLIVDDTKLDEILWMQVDESGKQNGAVKSIALGASVADLESITYGDGYFYVSGSQYDQKDGEKNAIARFKFDAGSQTIKSTEVVPNLRDFLLTNVPELKGEGEKQGKEGGLNIEGMAWDPKRNRLLLGLRSPQLNGNALIVPLVFQNSNGAFSIDNLKVVDSHAIQLPLEGLGIRDIQFDNRLDAFLIISGAPEHHDKKLGFKLWQWNGESTSADSGLQALADLDTLMKPEGITHFDFGGHDFIFIVGDAGVYTKLDLTESD
jgi:pSer/pThr/pTyr-binding forkhead associated (FHA) protein